MEKIKGIDVVVLNQKEVEERTGLDDSAIVSLMYEGGFPEPVFIHGEQVGWSEKEIKEWIWIRAIQLSWNKDGRWQSVSYSTLREPSNVLGLNSEIVDQIQTNLKELYGYEDRESYQKRQKIESFWGDSFTDEVVSNKQTQI